MWLHLKAVLISLVTTVLGATCVWLLFNRIVAPTLELEPAQVFKFW